MTGLKSFDCKLQISESTNLHEISVSLQGQEIYLPLKDDECFVSDVVKL